MPTIDDKRIADLLPATLPLSGSEIIPLDQGGVTLRATVQDVVNKGKNVSAASRLLGRGSAGGAGPQQELTIDSTLQLTGTVLSVTPGTYGNAQTADPLSQFGATTSAQLAGVLTDETGSGSAVFANGPTLSNPVVGTQTAGNNTTLAASTAFVTAAVAAVAAAFRAAINVFTKNQSVAPTVVSSATGTYTADASTSNNFQLTLTGNLTLANPTNLTSGMVLNFTLDEDATGGRTITLGSLFKFPGGTVPTWITTASAKNFISGYYDGTIIRCGAGAGYA